jgi:predicted amidophosphoribosyltransferase
LAELLTEQDFDVVIPAPYHWRKSLKKGHNPVAQLANFLAQQLAMDYCAGVSRPLGGHSQQGLTRRKRLQLSARNFAIKAGMDVVGGN